MGGASIDTNNDVGRISVQQVAPLTDAKQQNDSTDLQVSKIGTDDTATLKAMPIVLEHQTLEASYEYDQHLRQIIIKFKQPGNEEVVRQLPPEQVVKMLTDVMTTIEKEFDVIG